MNYKHLSQIERYQIASLMKAQHSITQIASLIGRHKPTISRELRRNAGSRGYRPKQASELAIERSKQSRNAYTVAPWVKEQASALLRLQWSPEQVASRLPVSHETLYQHVYADKTQGGNLWKNLRCQKQKRKRHASGRDRRGQIPNRRPLSERPAHIEGRRIVGHWECDTVIGANHKQAIVTVVERKSGYAVMAKVSNKTADLVSHPIIKALTPFEARVKTLTYDNGKEFCGHALIAEALKSTGYFAKQLGLKPVTTPVTSPQSNGIAESFVKTLKWDYAKLAERPDSKTVMAQLPKWFDDYNSYHPHSALGYVPAKRFREQRAVN